MHNFVFFLKKSELLMLFVNHSQCGLTGDFILHVLTIIMLAVIIKKSGTMIAIFLL